MNVNKPENKRVEWNYVCCHEGIYKHDSDLSSVYLITVQYDGKYVTLYYDGFSLHPADKDSCSWNTSHFIETNMSLHIEIK